MGDYLKVAADKARGRAAPAIQPRIPSLFEPPAVALSARFTRFAMSSVKPEHQQLVAGEPSLEPARTRTPEAQTSLPAGMRSGREVLPTIEPERHARVENRETNHAPVLPEIRQKVRPAMGAFESHEEVTTPVATTPPTRVVATPRTTQKTGSQAPLRMEPAQANNPAPVPRPEIKQEVHSRTVERHLERSVVKEVIERVRGVKAQQTSAHPLNAAVGPVRSAPAPHETSFPAGGPLEDARPVINVVIERVSVNAVTERPAVAAKAKQPPPPMLSLDRYLEQRRGQS